MAAYLAGIPERIGVSDGGACIFNTHHAPFRGATGHFVERYWAALAKRWRDIPPAPFAGYAPTGGLALGSLAVDVSKNGYICLMPGSVWPSKAWPMGHFRDLAQKSLLSGLDVLILGTMSEKRLGDAILDGRSGHNLCGQTDLRQAAAWLHGAKAAVGNDSGLSHLAAVCGTRTIAIFGPTDAAASAPWGPSVTALKPQESHCSPCFRRECPLPRRECLEGITPEQAWECIGL
jgi:heptosyltransferase-2